MSNVIKISPEQAKRAIALCIKAQCTPMLIGPVGTGKTTAVVDFVKTLNKDETIAALKIMILSQCDISDFSLPREINGRVHQCPAAWLPLKEDETDNDPFTFIMFDELDRADPGIQNMALNLLLGRTIAGKEISSKVFFIAAGNSTSDIYTSALSRAMINRLCMLYIGSSFESYEKWANENSISPARIAFQKFHGEELIDHKDEFEDVSFPTNRSLDAVDRIDALIESNKIRFQVNDIIKAVTAGLIGVPAALEYRSFKELHKNMPMPDKILANPRGFDSSDVEPSVVYALVNSVMKYAANDIADCEKALQFLLTLSPEFRKSGATTLIQHNPEAITCKSYSRVKDD
jgi:MoxR-like ATPase